jgi:hypothetical protein
MVCFAPVLKPCFGVKLHVKESPGFYGANVVKHVGLPGGHLLPEDALGD